MYNQHEGSTCRWTTEDPLFFFEYIYGMTTVYRKQKLLNAPHTMLLLPATLISRRYSPKHEEFHACASILKPLANWLQSLLVVYFLIYYYYYYYYYYYNDDDDDHNNNNNNNYYYYYYYYYNDDDDDDHNNNNDNNNDDDDDDDDNKKRLHSSTK